MKLCKDCRYSENTITEGLYSCTHPNNYVVDLQSGKRVQDERFCNVQRSVNFLTDIVWGMCGSRGRWWEPKDV